MPISSCATAFSSLQKCSLSLACSLARWYAPSSSSSTRQSLEPCDHVSYLSPFPCGDSSHVWSEWARPCPHSSSFRDWNHWHVGSLHRWTAHFLPFLCWRLQDQHLQTNVSRPPNQKYFRYHSVTPRYAHLLQVYLDGLQRFLPSSMRSLSDGPI